MMRDADLRVSWDWRLVLVVDTRPEGSTARLWTRADFMHMSVDGCFGGREPLNFATQNHLASHVSQSMDFFGTGNS